MTLAWMFYALIVAAYFALAAYATEWVLRAFRLPARWTWTLAIIGSSLIPLLAFLPEANTGSEATVAPLASTAVSQGVSAALEWTATTGTGVNATVVLLWGSASLMLLVVFTWSTVHITRERRSWRVADVAGRSVLVSRTAGPAVVGVGPATIVVPEWVLGLDDDLQRLIIRHEEEHCRARDLWLAVGGIIAIVAFPWNLPLWWQRRRLGLAIEIDCDRRVLENGASVRSYAQLLLASAEQHFTRIHPAAMALAESSTALERRIDDMTRTRIRSRATRSIMHGVAAIGLVVVACDTPVPEAPTLSEQAASNLVHVKLVPVVEEADSLHFYWKFQVDRADKDPLYVVDGVMLERGDIDIDRIDIESIEVVKGTAAEVLYGERGSNGVVHIRTVKGSDLVTVELLPIKERPESGN